MPIDTFTDDFFLQRLDHRIDLRHGLAVLASRNVQRQPERVKKYFAHGPIRYAA